MTQEPYLTTYKYLKPQNKHALFGCFVYCNQGEVYCDVKLYEFDSVPTDEWLLQIGIQKYVESSHVVK